MVERANPNRHQDGQPGSDQVNDLALIYSPNRIVFNPWINRELTLDLSIFDKVLEAQLGISGENVKVKNEPGEGQSDEEFASFPWDTKEYGEMNSFYQQDSSLNDLFKTESKEFICDDYDQQKGFENGGVFAWGAPMDMDSFRLDQVFQVEQSDLVQSPTLAELNSNNEPIFDLELETQFQQQICSNKKTKAAVTATAVTGELPTASTLLSSTQSFPCTSSQSTSNDENRTEFPPSVASTSGENNTNAPPTVKRKTSAATAASIASTKGKTDCKRERKRSGFSVCSVSSLSSYSNDDEGFGSQPEQDDEDFEEDSDAQLSSDEDANSATSMCSISWNPSAAHLPVAKRMSASSRTAMKNARQKKYFWQYNIQSKGPKVGSSSRSSFPPQTKDPHVLDDARDPVFSPECHMEGVKHAGKARRGDGNDLTPCPRKLCNIGTELNGLNEMINDLMPVSDVPFNSRPKSRKEKNKLASRACRLKKKAQHEANKLTLYGLQREHQLVTGVIKEARSLLRDELKLRLNSKGTNETNKADCCEKMEKVIEKGDSLRVAGLTADFVNSVLEKVSAGEATGGIDAI